MNRWASVAPLPRPTLRLCRLFDAADVALGVLELQQPADSGDLALLEDDLAAVGDDRLGGRVDVVDADRAFEAVHALPGNEVMALLQRARDARVVLVAGRHQEEAGRPPRLKLPTEDLLVEALR